MANLHAPIDSTCKSRISKFPPDVSMGGQSSLTMCRLNLNSKISGVILVSHTGGSIIFHHVQASEMNSKIFPIWGGNLSTNPHTP